MSGIENKFQQKEQIESDIYTLFSTLKRFLEKKSALYWHIKTFDKYVKEGLNPLGLRIQIFPTLENVSQELKHDWERILNECSKNLMVLLQTEYLKQSKQIDSEVSLINKQLLPLNTSPLYLEQEQKLKTHLEEYNKSILQRKDKKYWRDKIAFNEGKAYKWYLGQRNMRRRNDYKNDYFSSDSSASNSSQVETRGRSRVDYSKRVKKDKTKKQGNTLREQTTTSTHKDGIISDNVGDNHSGQDPTGSQTGNTVTNKTQDITSKGVFLGRPNTRQTVKTQASMDTFAVRVTEKID